MITCISGWSTKGVVKLTAEEYALSRPGVALSLNLTWTEYAVSKSSVAGGTVNVNSIAMKTGYTHSSSDWQFSPANTFATIVHQSLGNSTNLVSYTLPNAVNLSSNTTYYVRIRFNINPT